jgi:hypothetical protein
VLLVNASLANWRSVFLVQVSYVIRHIVLK